MKTVVLNLQVGELNSATRKCTKRCMCRAKTLQELDISSTDTHNQVQRDLPVCTKLTAIPVYLKPAGNVDHKAEGILLKYYNTFCTHITVK